VTTGAAAVAVAPAMSRWVGFHATESVDAQWGVNKVSPRAAETLLRTGRASRAETGHEQEKLNSAEARRRQVSELKIGWPSGRAGSSPAPGIA
jgi:hypothetical protein